MAGLMDLFITIGAEDQASDIIKNITGAIGKGLTTAAKVGVAAVTAVAAGAAALGTAFVNGAMEVAAYGDNIDKMSQKMGLSAQAYQEWDFILQHSGASIDSMQRGMMTLTLAAENGSDAFQALGMSQEDVAGMSQDQLFSATIEGLQGITDEGERAALAQKLLGSAAKELGPLLNTSAEDTEAMRQQVHELGGVMSDEAVKASAQFQDSLQNMKTAFSGVKMQMMAQFLPSVSTVMDGVSKLMSGDKSGIGMIVEGVKNFATQIQEVVPDLIEAATSILEPVIEAVADILPELIVTLLPVLLDAVVKIIVALAGKIPEILEALWTAIKTVFADTPVGDFFADIWGKIQGAFSAVKEWFSTTFGGAWDAIKEAFSAVGGWFSDTFAPVQTLFEGAFSAIQTAAETAAGWITSVFQPVADFFTNLASIIEGLFTKADAWAAEHGGGGTGWEGMNAIGNDFVPYDGYRAVLHRGEAVLTAREAEEWRRGEGSKGVENVFNFYGVSQSDMEMIAEYVNRSLA